MFVCLARWDVPFPRTGCALVRAASITAVAQRDTVHSKLGILARPPAAVHLRPRTPATPGPSRGRATAPAALAEVRKLGYASVINLRVATEAGAEIAASAAAAKAAGLTFIHLPFDASAPDPMLVDRFLAAVTEPKNQPVFIHCASANRAAALWMIKRMVVDRWDEERAAAEAADLGLVSPALKTFAVKQSQARR